MNIVRYTPYEDPFGRRLLQAAALHVLVVLLFVVKTIWIPSQDMIIQSAMRVDIVDLPDKVSPSPAPEPAPAPKVELAKPKPKAPPEINPKSIQTAQEKALEKLKAQQAIERLKNEVAEEKAKKQVQPQTYKGNVVTAGNSLTGLQQIDFDRYFGVIEGRIRGNWNLPGWLAQAQLRAQARVLIDKNGQIIRRQVVKGSGNEAFDAQVLEAIDRSAPFPEPPSRLVDVLALSGIIFNFPE